MICYIIFPPLWQHPTIDLVFHSLWFLFWGLLEWQIPPFYEFLSFYKFKLDLVSWIELDYVFCLKIPNDLNLFSRTDSGLCLYHLSIWSKFSCLHKFWLVAFPTQSCLLLFSFCASLQQFADCVFHYHIFLPLST